MTPRAKAFCHIYAQWDQVGDAMAEDAAHLLDLGLVCDTTLSFRQTPGQAPVLRRLRQSGGLCAPNLYPHDCDPACADPNWWKYSEEECVRLLERARKRFDALDLGAMEAINTYTPGNSLIAACRRTGVRHLLGFCAPTVIEDGAWEIAHYGSPLSPYFVSGEDFRKPENPGAREDSVLMASMELRNPMVCLNHWSEGPWCPLNAQAADRWLEPSAEPLPFLQLAEDWLRQTELSGRTAFFHINLQYFFAGRCREHNRKALEWLARERDKGRLEIGGLRAWSRRLRENGGFLPQSTYWSGEMMGFHVGHRPGLFPDVVVDENLHAQTVWMHPDPRPQRLYSYQRPWSYPSFQPDGSAPASENFDTLRIAVRRTEEQGLSRAFEVEIENDGARRFLPLLAWDAFEGWDGPFAVEELAAGWESRIIPHPSGSGGALRLAGMAGEGKTVLRFRATGGAPTSRSLRKSWPDLVEARTFFRERRPYTLLAAQTPEPFSVKAELRGISHPVTVESLSGIDHEVFDHSGDGPLELRFDGARLACWHRLWGVAAEQIELRETNRVREELRTRTADAVSRAGASMNLPEPGYQLFGNIRDASRWDRKLARAAGERERLGMNAWFARQRPDAGETVIEAHPGIYLPRGSITKVLGHEFDRIVCADGYGFRELCFDYPQGWDWGVAAWVQWSHLAVEIRGLAGAAEHALHLHAFDPEGRDFVQQVYFFDMAKPMDKKCLIPAWPMAKGLSGRWEPEALCSIPIPEACRAWTSLGVWIVPEKNARAKAYDWVAERSAPGLLSHLWLTRR